MPRLLQLGRALVVCALSMVPLDAVAGASPIAAAALPPVAGVVAATAARPVAATAARPKGVRVEPGMWEFVSSLPDPLRGEAIQQKHRTCVRDRLITPERVMARLSECRIWNATFNGPAARWRMSCETPAGPITGGGNLRTNGVVVAGTIELSYAIGGFEIPVTSPFEGRRIGGCR